MASVSNRNNQLSTKICAKDKPQNVGDQLRRYEKLDVALHLVCNVTLAATTPYELQHVDQLRLDPCLLLFNATQLAVLCSLF